MICFFFQEKDGIRVAHKGLEFRRVHYRSVIKGEMSFVGPRPERPEFVKQLAQQFSYYNERHRVKPGITGWAQLHYIYSDSIEGGLTKLQYDLYYVRNYSLLLDLFIVIQTVRVILWPAGAR